MLNNSLARLRDHATLSLSQDIILIIGTVFLCIGLVMQIISLIKKFR